MEETFMIYERWGTIDCDNCGYHEYKMRDKSEYPTATIYGFCPKCKESLQYSIAPKNNTKFI